VAKLAEMMLPMRIDKTLYFVGKEKGKSFFYIHRNLHRNLVKIFFLRIL